jgi:hypothetical protein
MRRLAICGPGTCCLAALLLFSAIFSEVHAQKADGYPLPVIIEKNGRHALMVDGKPFFILGGQAHNSSAWPSMLPKVWQAIDKLHANTLEVPLYWEQVEASQGKFDFSLIDSLLLQARAHRVRLVLLWFATWKNGSNHYMPGWMKKESKKYPNIVARDGRLIDSPAPDAEATAEADTRAFTAVMRYLKGADRQRTVIMVQVENEPGAWDTVRDFAPAAQKSFEGPVPPELLQPAILQALHVPVVSTGSWQEVFGGRADEYFHAWSVARFIGRVAAAGKAVYPLPLYVNAALRDPLTDPAATGYESGGPTDNVIPIWKAAAPAIDVLAPDIYLSGTERVLKVLDLYDRSDNPLFVPEAGLTTENAKYLYATIGHGGIGFSPFGIDDNHLAAAAPDAPDKLAPYGQAYTMLAPMMPALAQWSFEGKVRAVVEAEDHAEQKIDLGDWQAGVSFGTGRGYPLQGNTPPTGKVLIVQLSKDAFLLTGTGCRVTFHPLGGNAGKAWQYLKVEEGTFTDGEFHALRILNGDETDWGGPLFGPTSIVLRATLQVR